METTKDSATDKNPLWERAYSVELGKFWLNEETHKWVRWHERYLVVYSQSLAASAIHGQQQRILTARTALDFRGRQAPPNQDRQRVSWRKPGRKNPCLLTTGSL